MIISPDCGLASVLTAMPGPPSRTNPFVSIYPVYVGGIQSKVVLTVSINDTEAVPGGGEGGKQRRHPADSAWFMEADVIHSNMLGVNTPSVLEKNVRFTTPRPAEQRACVWSLFVCDESRSVHTKSCFPTRIHDSLCIRLWKPLYPFQ